MIQWYNPGGISHTGNTKQITSSLDILHHEPSFTVGYSSGYKYRILCLQYDIRKFHRFIFWNYFSFNLYILKKKYAAHTQKWCGNQYSFYHILYLSALVNKKTAIFYLLFLLLRRRKLLQVTFQETQWTVTNNFFVSIISIFFLLLSKKRNMVLIIGCLYC